MGLLLNCANSALYMANYNLVVPSVRSFLTHLGANAAAAGLVIGCCDLASMPSTVGMDTLQMVFPVLTKCIFCPRSCTLNPGVALN